MQNAEPETGQRSWNLSLGKAEGLGRQRGWTVMLDNDKSLSWLLGAL